MEEKLQQRQNTAHAWLVAQGLIQSPEEPCGKIWGAKNCYNARGKGDTYVRRVYRNGTWNWLSEPASRGRFLAADRHDVRYGYVYIGDVIAEYTLGSKTPYAWKLVTGNCDGVTKLANLNAVKLKQGKWRLRVASIVGEENIPEYFDVSEPYWR